MLITTDVVFIPNPCQTRKALKYVDKICKGYMGGG